MTCCKVSFVNQFIIFYLKNGLRESVIVTPLSSLEGYNDLFDDLIWVLITWMVGLGLIILRVGPLCTLSGVRLKVLVN